MKINKVFIVSYVLFSISMAFAKPDNNGHIHYIQSREKKEETITSKASETDIFEPRNSCNPMIDPRCDRSIRN